MVHTTSSSTYTNNKINKKTLPSTSQFKSSLEQAKNQSTEVLKAIVVQYEQELSRLERFEQELNEKDALMEERELVAREEIKAFEEEKQATLKDLAELEERISLIERKLSSTTSIETKLGKNQVVKLNIGGKIFSTSLETLKSVKDTFFTGYFNDHFNPQPEQDDNAYFIDRPFEQFHLILNYLRGIDITNLIKRMNEDDLNEFIDEVVYYQITPIYDLLPPKGRKQLSTQYGIELEKSLKGSSSEIVKFDPNYCSSKITLESETRARYNSKRLDRGSVLGTISNSYKVKLICFSYQLMIGFAPKSINVNKSDNYKKCGYYLDCDSGTLFSQNGDYITSYISRKINNGSIVECLLDKENGTISYKVDDTDYGIAYSNIGSNIGGSVNVDELFPAFDVGVKGCTFELLNE